MSETQTVTIAEFLVARYNEAAGIALQAMAYDGGDETVADLPDPIFQHVVRNGPNRVLAECEAKRRIVKRPLSTCGAWRPEGERDEWYNGHYPDEHYLGHCDGCSAAEAANADMDWVRKVLALPYANHPDYRQEWRP